MPDKGEWDLPTYKIEKKKLENKKEHLLIELEKAKLTKREVELTLSEYDTKIQELNYQIEQIEKQISWCMSRIKAKENGL